MQLLISTNEDAKAQRGKSCPIPQRICSHCQLPDLLPHTLSILPAGVSLESEFKGEGAFHYRIHGLWYGPLNV